MAKLTNPEPLTEEVRTAFETLRAKHGVRALTADESGSGVDRLPAGVFGFTYSPAEDNFPLFRERELRSFEGHKLADGSVVLLGFVTPEEKEAFDGAKGRTTLHLFPEPRGTADRLAVVPMSRVVSHVENSARRGTGFELQVGPES